MGPRVASLASASISAETSEKRPRSSPETRGELFQSRAGPGGGGAAVSSVISSLRAAPGP